MKNEKASSRNLIFSPYGREPGLLVARQSCRTVIFLHLNEACAGDILTPGGEIEEAAIAAVAHAFLIVSAWIRAKQDAPGLNG